MSAIFDQQIGEEVANNDYHRLPGVSNSQLKDFMVDPRVYHYKYLSGEYQPESKPHFDFGSAVHELCLLGDASNIAVIPEEVLSESGARSGAAWKAFEAENTGKLLLKQPDMEAVNRCVEAVKADPVAGELLAAPGVCERFFRATDENNGLELRCKVDKLCEVNGRHIVLDLKTASRGTGLKSFPYSVCDYRYDCQDYFYRKVLAANGINVEAFVFVAIGTTQPHTVDCYSLDDDFLREAQTDVEQALFEIAERTRTNNWHASNRGKIVKVAPPRRHAFRNEYTQ